MRPGHSDLRAMLAAQGFESPDRWIEYAWRHGLRRVPARRIESCPDCGSPASAAMGQFVHYSHLGVLRECRGCGLLYSDLRLSDAVTDSHYASCYKEDEYFLRRRGRVFRQLARLVDEGAPRDARVLDVGGATGHLMTEVRRRRPDLDLTLSDISEAACARARGRGLRTVRCDIAGLGRRDEAFDVVVMSDVIYLEPSLEALWNALPRLVAPGGLLLIRIPNKVGWLRLWRRCVQAFAPGRAARMDRIPFFNPEHLVVFPPTFLRARLLRIGFPEVAVLPSEMPGGDGWRARARISAGVGARWICRVLPGGPALTPSVVIAARRAPTL